MDNIKRCRIAGQVKRFCRRFAQEPGVALGQSPCSLNNGPYCKARARLALNLVERLGREVGERLNAAQPDTWRWRGREVARCQLPWPVGVNYPGRWKRGMMGLAFRL